MDRNSIQFVVANKEVKVFGYPELNDIKGIIGGDGMAFFFGKGEEMFIANMDTCKIRKMSTAEGILLVDNSEIDYETIFNNCKKGIHNAKRKNIRYAGINRWDGFKNGLCAISWMLYPDGQYFADCDGFGGESNEEENVYAIINANLEIVEPFRPIKNIEEHLRNIRKEYSQKLTDKSSNYMKTRIFNLIIIDESGSMQSIKKEAIDSVNETFQSIHAAQEKYEKQQDYFVSLVSFNDNMKTIYDCQNIKEISELTSVTYQPRCSTALYDAMGFSLNALRPKVAQQDKVLVTIVTDGYENSSKEYNSNTIRALVEELKSLGWVFAYIGANQDVVKAAATISIVNTLKFEATSEGTNIMGAQVSNARSRLFENIANDCFCSEEANENFFSEEK